MCVSHSLKRQRVDACLSMSGGLTSLRGDVAKIIYASAWRIQERCSKRVGLELKECKNV